ncbi:two-component regulator propeller domain-containing protein [Lutibacter sp.]|uniref:ligand-binding sensor domain-containing protein n=1 Tax=Lutibacter sp. TaxID=1925666 RepID=UPI002734435E|nr:sensor histidine kinase [Lutibacter sp.]MDP3312039.1 two-component regulator propeller domain-containing protein [Lutibacter sp.]
MLKKNIIFAVFFLFCFSNIHSQTPSYYHYTSSDGLASSTVYDIIQDKDGFMWFATANGISKFDGNHFATFRTKDGLNSNSIISLLEGRKGELYIGNFEKGINVLKNGKIENYCSVIDGKSLVISYLIFDTSKKNEQKIIAYNGWGDINLISETASGKLSTKIIKAFPVYINKLEKLANSDLMALTTTGLYDFKVESLSKLNIKGLPETSVFCLANGNDGSYYIGTKGTIYQLKNKAIIGTYKIDLASNNEVTAILSDKNNNIWFSNRNSGFYMIPNGSNKIIDIGSKLDLQNTLVNKYFEDKEGNIWISTFGKGVYCINNLYLKSYNENDGLHNNNVYAIAKVSSGKLLLGTFNGVSILENGKFDQIKNKNDKTLSEYIYNIKNLNNEFYVCGSVVKNDTSTISYKDIKLHLFDGLSFCKLSNGLYLFGGRTNYIRVQNKFNDDQNQASQVFVFGEDRSANRINQIFEDSEKTLWIGTGHGLCKASVLLDKTGKLTLKKTFFKSNSILNSKINAIIQDNDHNIWVAGEKGIVRYNLKNNSITDYENIGDQDLSSSTSVVSDKKNRIWVGNMKGLYLVDGNTIKYFNKQTGLPSDEVYSLFYDEEKNQLVIGSSAGITFLDIDLFDKDISPKLQVKIMGVKAGDSVYTNYNHLVFGPEQRNVSINFKALNFSSSGSVRYQYRLDDSKWKETHDDVLNFLSLKNGKYNLLIRAKSQNGNWSNPAQISFEVKPRFTETVWFKFLMLLIVALVSSLMVAWQARIQQRKTRKKLKLNQRINDLKHQALSAMMNPHFIFNSLNSVQYLINSNRNEEANDYIAMMAKLIRKNLETAGSGFILLSEEVNRLKLYLNLEKLRFQERFSYEIIIGNDIDSNAIMIPNMILQPFVENALWHGIINSGVKGMVSISFSFENVEIDAEICKSLMIKVTDNGIGIIEARKHKKANHISKGIEIIEERLRLLSEKMELPQPIMIDDLSNQNNNTHGTEVIISLPPPLYQIIQKG